MPPATFASTTALIGGSLWLLESALGGSGDALGLTLRGAGLALVLLAVAVAATRLVTGSAVALRAVVCVAAPLLVWSVLEFFRPGDAEWYAAVWGVFALGAGALGLWRSRGERASAPRPSRGAHAR
jgi:hypothetical protein